MRTRLAITLPLLTLALAACSGGTPAAAPTAAADANEAAYLAAASAYPDLADLSDDEILKPAYLICRELAAGRIASEGTLTWAAGNLDVTPVNTVAGLKATTLCPDWYKG